MNATDQDESTPLDPERVALLRSLGPGDSTQLFLQLTEVFLASAPELVGRLREAVADGDVAAVRTAAHELAGASENVGAIRLADLARAVEGSTADGALVPAEGVEALHRELERTGQALRQAARG